MEEEQARRTQFFVEGCKGMSEIVQLLPVSTPLFLQFPRVSETFSAPVEFMALVDYDGKREVEYGAIVDGKMMIFSVDGHHVVLIRQQAVKRFQWHNGQISEFQTELNEQIRKVKKNGYE